MAGILHALDQRRLIDSNGIADGGSIAFYTTGTLTPATIYSDAALTTPRANPVVVAAGAAVPDIYLDDAVTYRRIITYPDGSTDDADPYSAPWATRAELENITGGGVSLPPTTSPSTGVITKGGSRFIHDYNDGSTVGNTIGQNTFVGVLAGNFTLSGVANTCVGASSGSELTSASLTTMFGTRAGAAITSGGVNSGFGADALATCTTGEYNDGFGCKALTNTTTGSRNKAFGQSTLLHNTTGNDNCAHGQEALIANLTGHRNNAYGNFSQYTSTDKNDNCSYGTNSLRNNTADGNCAFGNYSFISNTTGTNGVAIGFNSGYSNTTGSRITAIGSLSLYGNTSGEDNAAVGFRAGYGSEAGDQATTVDTNCTFLGSYSSRDSSVPTTTSLTNSTVIGAYARFTKSNQVVIGHTTVTETVLRGVQQSTVYTVATLPTGAVGMRAFVSDATSATFGDTAAGTGSNKVPVFHDGTNWRVG